MDDMLGDHLRRIEQNQTETNNLLRSILAELIFQRTNQYSYQPKINGVKS
jgi:hypothetical protein